MSISGLYSEIGWLTDPHYSAMMVCANKKIIGLIAVADTPREEVKTTILINERDFNAISRPVKSSPR